METLLAIVLFSGALTAMAVIYRAVEKRSSKDTSASQPTKPPVSLGQSIVAPPPALDATVSQAMPPELPAEAPKVSPTVDSAPVVTPPPIPDPWLAEDEVTPVPVSAAPASTRFTAASPPFTGTSDRAELSAVIDRIGQSGQLQQVANLQRYANHPDSKVRASVATAFGKLAANKPGKSLEGIIPVLGRLSQDAKPEVRLAAIQALGNIRSPQVLPWLQQAQRTATGEVGKAVTVALQNLKLIYQPKPKAPVNPVISKTKGKKN